MTLDCTACKSQGSMSATTVPRFSGIVRVIGGILLVPSFFGMLFAGVVFFVAGNATTDTLETAYNETQRAGATIAGGIGFAFTLFMGVISLVGGLFGWLMLMVRKFYRCVQCSFILDRT